MKHKILFFVTEFWQAGTQRFTYELDRILDKGKFEVSILSFRKLNSLANKEDFYYQLHTDLGTKIFFLSDILEQKKFSFTKKNSGQFLLDQFLNDFQVISFMGEYSFLKINSMMSDQNLRKSVIHIMNTKFQYPAIYDGYDKEKKYVFCSSFQENEFKEELSDFKYYRHHYFPFGIKIDSKVPLWKFPNQEVKKIAIFTRVTKTKPLEPFLFAFHLLSIENEQIELHIFGGHDDYVNEINFISKYLNIESKVFFRGHQKEMNKVALEENINLVWFHSFYGTPGGYAGFDIASLGIPQFFWNFTNSKNDNLSNEFKVFNNLNQFVRESHDILYNKEIAESLSVKQLELIIDSRNIEDQKPKFEKMYNEIILLNEAD